MITLAAFINSQKWYHRFIACVPTAFIFIFVFVFQGGIVLLAGVLEPLLSPSAIAEITCVGSVMIMGLGLNLAGISKIKVANYFPALILAPVICVLFGFLSQYIPALG